MYNGDTSGAQKEFYKGLIYLNWIRVEQTTFFFAGHLFKRKQ